MSATQDRQYGDMNAGAHRKPHPVIGNPAVIWHRCFWRIENSDDKRWKDAIDQTLFNIFIRIYVTHLKSDISFKSINLDRETNKVCLFNNRFDIAKPQDGQCIDIGDYTCPKPEPLSRESIKYQVFSIQMTILGCRIGIRATLQDEFWTLTLSCDYSQTTVPEGTYRSCASLARPTPSQLIGFDISSVEWYIAQAFLGLDQLTGVIVDRHNGRSQDSFAVDELLNGANRSLNQSVYKIDRLVCDPGLISTLVANDGGIKCSILSPFASFFGISLGIDNSKGFASKVKYPLDGRENFPATSVMDKIAPMATYSEESCYKLIDAAWPVIQLFDSNKTYRHYFTKKGTSKLEYCINLFGRKRTIYASSLGHTSDLGASGKSKPLVYMLLSTHNSRWQLGRLIEKLNELGTYRLAALRDLRDLERVNDEYRIVQGGIRKYTVANLAKKFDNINSSIEDGVLFRLEKSRKYVRTFHNILSTLDIDRIEGYQPYNRAVQRRMFEKFEFIESLRERYDNLRRAIILRENYQRSSDLKRILSFGEIVSIIPINYYLYHIIEQLFKFIEFECYIFPAWMASSVAFTSFILIRQLKEFVDGRRSIETL